MADDLVEEDVVDDEDAQPTSGRKRTYGNSHSGWCLSKTNSDEHERCPVIVGSFTCTCACAGHGSRAGEEPAWVGQVLDNPDECGMLEIP